MTDNLNFRDTIVPKSDQLNAEQLLSGPITITVESVSRGTAEQPVTIHYMGDDGRPYKPGKSMRKVLVFAWGEDGSKWVGRTMTIYNKQDVKFGGVEVGGIRISGMSHIEADIKLSLTSTRGKKEQFIIKKIEAAKFEPKPKVAAKPVVKTESVAEVKAGDDFF
jgi:hypothetical protein